MAHARRIKFMTAMAGLDQANYIHTLCQRSIYSEHVMHEHQPVRVCNGQSSKLEHAAVTLCWERNTRECSVFKSATYIIRLILRPYFWNEVEYAQHFENG